MTRGVRSQMPSSQDAPAIGFHIYKYRRKGRRNERREEGIKREREGGRSVWLRAYSRMASLLFVKFSAAFVGVEWRESGVNLTAMSGSH